MGRHDGADGAGLLLPGRGADAVDEPADNVELSRRAADAFNRRDLDAFLDLHDRDVLGVPLATDMEGEFRGHAGTRRWWTAQFDTFPDMTIEILDIRAQGDATVAALRMRGHGAGGSVPVDMEIWRVTRWRDGRCYWWASFRTEADALAAAGAPPVSENVDLVRRMNAAFNRGDLDAAFDFYAPAAVWHSRSDEPDTGDYVGRDAIREMAEMWQELFDDFRLELDDYVDAGDKVVTTGWIRGRGRGSGVDVRDAYCWIIRVERGQLQEIWEYHDLTEALAALGLSD